MKKNISQLIILLFVTSIGCAQQKNNLPSMTAAELKTEMAKDTSLIILDVRTPAELTGPIGQIPGVINIPVQILSEKVGELEKYKNNKIAVICRSGNRSRVATKILLQKGFKAINVLGGMKAYNKLKE